jgi:hypothetical protein
MSSQLQGFWYRVDAFSGRYFPLGDAVAAASSPGDNTVCVTSPGADPEPMVCQALNAAASISAPVAGRRWTVVWATLKTAWQGSTTTPLVATTA